MSLPILRGLALAAALSLAGGAGAAEKADPKKQGPQEVNFEDDTIQGDLTKPDGSFIDVKRETVHSKLIQIRTDFREEVLDSVGEL